MSHLHKEYSKPFLLEPTKLRRLVDRIHDRLSDHANTIQHDVFEVFFTGNRRAEMADLDQVLALDNSKTQKITALEITCFASTPGAARPEHEVQVGFARPKPSSTGSTSKVVAVSVRSNASGWASRTLSEVEEQVERNWLEYWPQIAGLLGLGFVLLFVLIVQVVTPANRLSSNWFLTDSEAILVERPTLTDADLRQVSTAQLRNLVEDRKSVRAARENRSRRSLFLLVPIGVVVGCAVVLAGTCYPQAVFLWGDEEKRYANITQRRKALWGVIVGVTVIGISSRLLFDGVSNWLRR
jgi:hypothetical protein